MSQYRATWLGNTSAVVGSPRFAKSLCPIMGMGLRHLAGPLLFRIVKFAVFTQDQTMIGCILDHLWGPMYAAPCIIPAKDRHDHPIIGADVFKPAENPRGMLKISPCSNVTSPASPLRPQKSASGLKGQRTPRPCCDREASFGISGADPPRQC